MTIALNKLHNEALRAEVEKDEDLETVEGDIKIKKDSGKSSVPDDFKSRLCGWRLIASDAAPL